MIPETTPETTPAAEEETEVKKEEKSGMNVKGLAAIVVAAILGFAGIAVYKKHGRSKDEDYVSEQLEFSDGPYVNEEDDEKEELSVLRDGNSNKDRGSQKSWLPFLVERKGLCLNF